MIQGVSRDLVDNSDSILLKVKNIQGIQGIDFENVEFIGNAAASKKLIDGDILSPFIGQAVRLLKFSMFHQPPTNYDYFADNNCGIIRSNPRKINRLFLLYALRTNFVGSQILQLTGGGGVPFLGAGNAKKIQIPKVGEKQQIILVEEMERARETRRGKLADADALLQSLDGWLLDVLGIAPPPADNRQTFAVRLSNIKKTARLNSDYFHPERILTIRAIENLSGKLKIAPLWSIVNFIRVMRKTPATRYFGLASVQSNTGELVEANEPAQGGCLEFRENDVLFARLRPYLNKVYRAESGGVCSPEFHVMRVINENQLNPDYLATILRSSLLLAQTRHMMTGNTHPRLTNEDVINLVIPIPAPETQKIIADEVLIRRQEARRLRVEAEAEWQAAKDKFEAALLGGGER